MNDNTNYPNGSIDYDDLRFGEAKALNTIDAYDSYLKDFPDGKHRQEVKELKKKLEPRDSKGVNGVSYNQEVNPWKAYEVSIVDRIIEISRTDISDTQFARELMGFLERGELTRRELIGLIKDDNNRFGRGVIKELAEQGWIVPDDLLSAGIDGDFIKAMWTIDDTNNQISKAETPTSIAQPTTEVYFWGIPSSGKSCVMAALMSVLKSGKIGVWEPRDCKGGHYMNQLAMLYEEGQVKVLLPGTPLMSTYEMAFNLTRNETSDKLWKRTETMVHPFTFIDLAGGILYLMYDYRNRRDIMAVESLEYLNVIENLIIGTSNENKEETNRKMHCFVIEYGAEDWRHQGLDQLTYLVSALQYIQKTKIFENKATDSIYVIVTKADRAKLSGEKLISKIKEYVTDEQGYYFNFYKRLKEIVEKCEISGGQVQIVPFTIGDVKMRSLCKFNSTAATALMNQLVERSIGFDISKLGQLQERLSE